MALLDVSDTHQLQGLEQYFDKDAFIVLESCSTGKEAPGIITISQVLVNSIKRRVKAPDRPTSLNRLIFNQNNEVIDAEYHDRESGRDFGPPK